MRVRQNNVWAYVLPKSQWQATPVSIKKDFMDNYGYKWKQFLSNPENAEALFSSRITTQ